MTKPRPVNTPSSHRQCMACGPAAMSSSPCHLEFIDRGEGHVCARLKSELHHQGYEGLMHGGMIATLLDSAMTNSLFSLGIEALTAELNIRYSKPVRMGRELLVSAFVVTSRRKVFQLEATLESDGEILAKAAGKFMLFN